jgi:hypothetical protein
MTDLFFTTESAECGWSFALPLVGAIALSRIRMITLESVAEGL